MVLFYVNKSINSYFFFKGLHELVFFAKSPCIPRDVKLWFGLFLRFYINKSIILLYYVIGWDISMLFSEMLRR